MAAQPYLVLAAARPSDPYLTWEVVPQQVQRAWGEADALLWLAPSAYHGKPWLTGMGEPAAVADLARQALAEPTADAVVGLSLPPAAFEHLPEDYRPRRLEHWTWWWTRTPPTERVDADVVPLAPEDPRLPALLDQSASVYLRPGDPRAVGWFGLEQGDRLVACLAHERHHPQVPHLASVVVDRTQRRAGFGARLCGSATAALMRQGAPAVSLAMMTANTAAASLYRSLGFTAGDAFASGTIPGRRDLPAMAGWRPGGQP
jgi:GNAT superfamily N-acetyltransferase